VETWHRITFGDKDNVDAALEALNIKYKKSPLLRGSYLLHIDITETDPRWRQIAALVREKNAPDMYNSVFTDSEITTAEWVRLMPVFERGYPQPEAGMAWAQLAYRNDCPKCGAGFQQKAPFRLKGEPHLGKHDFLCLYWTYTVFCTPKVLEALKRRHIQGYDVWEAIIHRTNQPSQVVSQLVFPHVAEPALADVDKLQPVTCPQCGITKYAYHKRGYMHLMRGALQRDVDVQVTNEWFGSGHSGFREILISNRLARLIVQEKWRGVALKPVILI
jgi:rubredoxin